MIYRIFVEKKDNVQARKEASDVKTLLNIQTEDFRLVLRYDVEGVTEDELQAAIPSTTCLSSVGEGVASSNRSPHKKTASTPFSSA